MEITNETKAKVFAQYLGQFAGLENIKSRYVLTYCLSDTYGISLKDCIVLDYKLILKPLSAITEQDATEAAKLTGADITEHNLHEWDLSALTKNFEQVFLAADEPSLTGTQGLMAIGFLQSKGYDLPNFYLGGKTLHQSGLAIYE